MKCEKKLTPLGHSAAPSRSWSGETGWPSRFNLFYFHTSWNHLCFKIYCQIFVKPPATIKKINETRQHQYSAGYTENPMVLSIKKLSKPQTVTKKSTNARRQNNSWFLVETRYPKPSFRVILNVYLEKSQCQKLTSFAINLPNVGFSGIQTHFFALKITIWLSSCT